MLCKNLKYEYKDEVDKFCKQYELNYNKDKRYVLGMNEYAQDIAEKFDVVGFVDDYTLEKRFMNKKIIKSDSLPADAMVIVCSLDRIFTASKKLKNLNINYLDYYAFAKSTTANLKQLEYWNGFKEDYIDNFNEYNNIYELLYDSESKDIFKKLINFRLSYDINYMVDFKFRIYEQYFENFLNLNNRNEIFADIGGFDGETTIEFIKRCPNYTEVYFFEPDEENFSTAKMTLNEFNNIKMYQLGLSNKKEQLKFSSSLGQSSKIDISGSVSIYVDQYDSIVKGPVTFVKMDIEGAEGKAIEGMTESILKYHPIMAIAVYHKHNDFWKIPTQVLSIRDDYKIYVRHYTEGLGESVMYFVPKSELKNEIKK